MTQLFLTKTSFTSGELDPELYGRIDVRAYDEGAAALRNVVVKTSGGVVRRPGSRLLAKIDGAARLLPFDDRSGGDILVLGPFSLSVVRDDVVVQQGVVTPWSTDQLHEITWTRIDRAILVCHPAVEPRLIRSGDDGIWALQRWTFDTSDDETLGPASLQPYARFVGHEVALQAVAAGRSPEAIVPAGLPVELRASAPVFRAGHLGSIVRIRQREIRIVNLGADPAFAEGLVLQPLVDGRTTRDWDEQMFGAARGWPVAVTQHQDRLVLGGNHDAPDRLWFSRTGRPFDFETGEGLDDQAITFRLRADGLHHIRQLVPGRRLQVLTSRGEWIVSGTPLTPANIQVDLQTNIGSPVDRQVSALEVDGATMFVGATGRDLREFLFTDTEQAFQAPDIAILSRHLMRDPVDMAFDPLRRLIAIVRGDGRLATVTIDRNANIVAWSLHETEGAWRAVMAENGRLTFLVERSGGTMLEVWDDELHLDCTVTRRADAPSTTFDAVPELAGATVMVLADSDLLDERVLDAADIELSHPASMVAVGLPFTHRIEALSVARGSGQGSDLDPLYRPVRLTFRVLDTAHLEADAGRGLERLVDRDAATGPLSGDIRQRAYGWRRGFAAAPWKIVQREPKAFSLLCVTTEMKVNS